MVKIIKDIIKDRDNEWIKAIEKACPQPHFDSATDVNINDVAKKYFYKYREAWQKLAKM